MLTLSACGKPTIEDCISACDREYSKVLDSYGFYYFIEFDPQDNDTNDKNDDVEYSLHPTVKISGNPTNQQIYNICTDLKSVHVSGAWLFPSIYVNSDYCTITHQYCLKRGGVYVYSPISGKNYDDLGYSDKKCICDWIQEQYDRYDKSAGQYTGDRYSDTIFSDAAELFGLSDSELKVIWMKKYDYK